MIAITHRDIFILYTKMKLFRLFGSRLYLLLILSQIRNVQNKDCVARDQCSCKFDDDSGIVDLTSLGSQDVTTPRFADQKLQDGNSYSYNPCYPFNEGNCKNAAVCLSKGSQTVQIGDADKVEFTYDDDSKGVLVAYASGTGTIVVTSIQLVCDKSALTPTFTGIGQASPGQYALEVTSICACPNACSASGPTGMPPAPGPNNPGSSGGLTIGSIICIAFLSILVVYCIAGAVFMKFKRKATGKEIVPNVLFWQTVPILIKDGVLFTFGKCRKGKTGYQNI